VVGAARRARSSSAALGLGFVLDLWPIRAKDVIDPGDVLLVNELIAQVLRMRLAIDSSVRKAQKILTALPTSTRARRPRRMLCTSASMTGSVGPEETLAAPARRVRGTVRSPACWLRLTLKALSSAMSSLPRSSARSRRMMFSSSSSSRSRLLA
jgi:hypothetical protein